MDVGNYFRYMLALALVLALIWVVGRLLPKLKLSNKYIPLSKRRLAVVESLFLDTKTRLVLVRRDDREHLLLLTLGQTGQVVEHGIAAKLPEISIPQATKSPTGPTTGPITGPTTGPIEKIAFPAPITLPPLAQMMQRLFGIVEKIFAFILAKSLGLSRAWKNIILPLLRRRKSTKDE